MLIQRLKTLKTPLTSAAILATLSGCGPHIINGAVLDRNGFPVERAIVSLSPGNVEIVTDGHGEFSIDYLRDDVGERIRLDWRNDYEVEVFKAGYHVLRQTFYYKWGELLLDPIIISEDTIRVSGSDAAYDPAEHGDRTHSAGQSLEGE
jgi:hypothetical protein